MDFGLSEEQRLLDDTVRRFLAERLPIARVRELRDDEAAFDAAAWKELAALGVVGCLVSEAHGGAGLGVLDAAVIATALGHGAAPLPFLSSAVLAPLLFEALGSAAQQQRWLPRLAAGETRVAVAAAECVERRQDAGVRHANGRLSGVALFVPDGIGAEAFLVPAGGDLWLVPADAARLEVAPLVTIDATRPLAELRFRDVAPAQRLGPAGGAGAALAHAIDVARVVLAADVLGCCDRALELAVAYAQQRRQFDRPIASFQAVKHLCAEMVAELEPARSLLWYAAHAFDALPREAPLMACHVLAHVSEIGREIASVSTQVHGGIGWTDEQNLHFWFKRIGAARHLLGGPEHLRDRAARLQGFAAA